MNAWEFQHETGCLCRATWDDGLLTVEITDGPPLWDPDRAETEHDLVKRGVARTALPSAQAAERELRLVAWPLREVSP